FDEGLLADVVTSQWVRPLHNPIDVVSYMFEKAAPSPVSSPLKISRTLSDVIAISFSPYLRVSMVALIDILRWLSRGAAEQFHKVPHLDVFQRTHGILDLAAQLFVYPAGDEPVELLDRVVPCERPGGEAG